jgi:hypothetical protein
MTNFNIVDLFTEDELSRDSNFTMTNFNIVDLFTEDELSRDSNFSKKLGWKLDLDSQQLLSTDGSNFQLTTAELELTKIFLDTPGRVLSRRFVNDWLEFWCGSNVDEIMSGLEEKLCFYGPSFPLFESVNDEWVLLLCEKLDEDSEIKNSGKIS